MTVISYNSIKGGVGKSTLAILTARCLGACGMRVLVIDLDINNATSFFFLNEETQERSNEKNIAKALFSSGNVNLNDYIMLTDWRGVDVIPSSLDLLKLQGSLSERRLKQLLPSIENEYDVVILDTHPDYTAVEKNALLASDLIITPIQRAQFDYNTAHFLKDSLIADMEKFNSWFLCFNGYDKNFEKAKGGKQKEYIELFRSSFGDNLTPVNTWLPDTPAVQDLLDRDMLLSENKRDSKTVCHEKLFNSIWNLCSAYFDNPLIKPEVF